MRRRDYLTALAGAGLLAGCSGNGSTDPAGETTTNDRPTTDARPTADSTTTVARTTATPRPTSAAVGEKLQLFGGVTGTVTELVEANEVTLGGETKPHNDGEVWVLAHVQIHNQRSTSIPTPWAEDWALLTGSTQVKSYREEHYVAGELDGPVDGDWYEEADPAHAGVTTQGWLLFSVDRNVSTVEIAMEPPHEWPIVASPSWAGQIDASAAPDITRTAVSSPKPVIGEKVPVTIKYNNNGGRDDQVQYSYKISVSGKPERMWAGKTTVPGEGTTTIQTQIQPTQMGTISIRDTNQWDHPEILVREVQPIKASLGEQVQIPGGINISLSDLTSSETYRYVNSRGEHESANMFGPYQNPPYAFCRVHVKNPHDEKKEIPGPGAITAIVNGETAGGDDPYEVEAWLSPLKGETYTDSRVLPANTSAEGVLAFPNVTTTSKPERITVSWGRYGLDNKYTIHFNA